MRLRMSFAILSYIPILLLFFKTIKKEDSVYHAFIVGASAYGIFDFTNLALFYKYDLTIALIDTLWGGILFASTKYLIDFL